MVRRMNWRCVEKSEGEMKRLAFSEALENSELMLRYRNRKLMSIVSFHCFLNYIYIRFRIPKIVD